MFESFNRKRSLSLGAFFIAVPTLIMAFQNCSPFQVSSALTKLSASCNAKIQESAPQIAKMLSLETPLDCEAAASYTCLVRKFSPDAESAKQESIACLASDSKTCVQTSTLIFNTRAARNAKFDAREFASGGEYNRVEAQCSHSVRYGTTALFVGLGDDLDAAFASAKSKCLASAPTTSQALNGDAR